MNREAAALGVPVYSIFRADWRRGPLPCRERRLVLLSGEDIYTKLSEAERAGSV